MFDAIHIPLGRHRFISMHHIRQRQPRRGRPPCLPAPCLPAPCLPPLGVTILGVTILGVAIPCLPVARLPVVRLPLGRAATGGRPYDDDNSVDVVGHYDEFINIDAWIIGWYFIPNLLNHITCSIQPHLPVHDFPKQAFSILGADGHEIGPGLGIIVSPQPD